MFQVILTHTQADGKIPICVAWIFTKAELPSLESHNILIQWAPHLTFYLNTLPQEESCTVNSAMTKLTDVYLRLHIDCLI